jgi:hypothetical protein
MSRYDWNPGLNNPSAKPSSVTKRKKTILKLPPISRRKPKALRSVVNNAFANAVLPVIEPKPDEWLAWLAIFGVTAEGDLTCSYCGKKAELLDHLNPTIIKKVQSGFFAELGNLVPACRPCNEAKRNQPWETWLKTDPGSQGQETIEKRIAALHEFERRQTPQRLQPRTSGDPQRWAEYDHIQEEIGKLLVRAQAIADDLRVAVTADYLDSRESLSNKASSGE